MGSYFLRKFVFMSLNRLFSLLALLYFCFSTSAQNSQLQHFSIRDGLPQSQVNDILQDKIGYLWIATEGGGLVKFDGNTFTTYNDLTKIPSNFIKSIYFKNDSIYIGSLKGVTVKKGKFYSHFDIPVVNKILQVNQQIIAATKKGIYLFKEGYFQPIKISTTLDTKSIYDLVYFENNYWIASEFGLWKINDLEKNTNISKVYNSKITSLLVNKNRLLVVAENKILEKKNNKFVSVKEISGARVINGINNQIFINSNNGLSILDNSYKEIKSFTKSIKNAKKVIKDRQNNIWIATSNGFFKYTINNFKHFDKNTGLPSNYIESVASDSSDVFVITKDIGLYKISKNRIYSIEGIPKKINTIAIDKKKRLWLGVSNFGIEVFNPKDNFSKIISIDESAGLISNQIKKIIINDSIIWALSRNNGISQVQLDSDLDSVLFIKNYSKTNGIRDLDIGSVALDKNITLWYGTKTGNIGFIDKNGVTDLYKILDEEIEISTLYVRKNTLFIGTLGSGIFKTSINEPNEFTQLSGVKKITSKNIYQIISDDNQNLWVGNENGINKVILSSNETINDVIYFGRNNGFLGIESVTNSITKDAYGNIWFGTKNGLTKYENNNALVYSKKPTVFLEKIFVNNQFISDLKSNEINKFTSEQNNFSFTFKTVDFNNPNGIKYQWKLNDHSSSWSSKNSVDFANLKGGNYAFQVRSKTVDGVFSHPKSFVFFISTPIYQQTSFIYMLSFVIFIILLLATFLFFRSLKKRNQEKIDKVQLEKNLLVLEQKALQLQMNPHFIFNVLNNIKAFGNSHKIEEMNQIISEFSKLLRSVLHNSRAEEISLATEIESLKNYLEIEKLTSTKKFDYDFQVNLEIDMEEVLIPPMILQPFVENSIKHGFVNNKDGFITITFHKEKSFLKCNIEDNGIGFLQSQKNTKIKHQSVALKVTRERLQSISSENNFSIHEIKENNVVLGSEVQFQIPFKTDF